MVPTPPSPNNRKRSVDTVTLNDLCEKIDALSSEVRGLPSQMTAAVEQGVISAASSLLIKARNQVAENTGFWLWRIIKGMVTRWLVIAAIVLLVGNLAGWPAAISVWKSIGGSK